MYAPPPTRAISRGVPVIALCKRGWNLELTSMTLLEMLLVCGANIDLLFTARFDREPVG